MILPDANCIKNKTNETLFCAPVLDLLGQIKLQGIINKENSQTREERRTR